MTIILPEKPFDFERVCDIIYDAAQCFTVAQWKEWRKETIRLNMEMTEDVAALTAYTLTQTHGRA